MEQRDAIVIGAGPGGYAAAIRLAQLGNRTLLVEKGAVGGVCLNVGCIPSKALISAAKAFDRARHGDAIGIRSKDVDIDFEQTQAWKDGVVNKLTGGIGKLCQGNGVEVVEGTARLVGAGRISVTSGEEETVYETRSVVIATGSRPIEIPGFSFDEETVLSSTGALALSSIPSSMLVVGGGYIGLELGSVYAKLGTQVTVVEMTDQLLPGFDRDIVQVISRKLKKMGVDIRLGTRAASWKKAKGGGATVQLEGDKAESLDVAKILVTVGRRPNTENLGLEDVGIRLEGPFIGVDNQLRTSVPGIYAIGDVAGQPMLAHKAAKEADVVAEVIAGHPAVMDVRTIPAVVFTDPEIATAGPSENELKAAGRDYEVGKFPLAALGRALTQNDTDGFVKIISDAESGVLLGVQVVGAGASDLISEAALAIEMGAMVEDLSLTVHPHPTMGESLMEAAKILTGDAVHTMPRKKPAKVS